MMVVQITDTHIEPPGDLAYARFDTAAALKRAVDTINAMSPAPDLVLHTGDLAHNGDPRGYRQFLDITEPLCAPLVALPGNHDEREAFRAAFSGHEWMPKTGEFLHFTIEDFAVRIVCCDSVIPGKAPGGLCPARLNWLREQLEAAPERPTIVALHHPPFASGMTGTTSNGLLEGGAELAELLRNHPQVVRLVAGHSHRAYASAFGGVVAFVAPTTCYPFALETGPERVLSFSAEPAGLAVHLWLEDQGGGEPGLVSHALPLGEWGMPEPLLRNGERVLAMPG